MNINCLRRLVGFAGTVSLAVIAVGTPSFAATVLSVDLDGTPATGAESNLSVSVLNPAAPCRVQNKVTNKAVGQNFSYTWYSAGPGGFRSATGVGTTTGVGQIWTWSTYQSITQFTGTSCATGSANDICFSSITSPGTSRGPFFAPGRRFTDSRVAVTSATLTASLSSFFSPPRDLAHAENSVQKLTSGLFRYTTTFFNPPDNTGPVTFRVAPGPLGCSDGCGKGETLCEGGCTDTGSDPDNCGSCGSACTPGEVCDGGECSSTCSEGETNCGGFCVDLQTDGANCGSCGNDCDVELSCKFGTYCYAGECFCQTPLGGELGKVTCEFPGTEPVTLDPGESFTRCIVSRHPAKEVTSQFTACGSDIPDGPVSCVDGPASQGPFDVFVPDLDKTIGPVFLTPLKVQVVDPSGDGLIQPGETVKLKVFVINAGSANLSGVTGRLTSPDVDLTDDGTPNPIPVTITGALEPYPGGIQGTEDGGDGDCNNNHLAELHPSSNSIPFMLTVPTNHPADVGRLFNLEVAGQVNLAPLAGTRGRAGRPTHPVGRDSADEGSSDAPGGGSEWGVGSTFNVPLVIGIGSACSPSANGGSFDGLQGLLSPMAGLVLPGNDIPFATANQGSTRPLKLKLTCGGVAVSGPQVTPPKIVGLSREGVVLDVTQLDLGDSPNRHTLFFRETGGFWHYNLRTRDLTRGSYVLTIRMPNGNDYVTGLILR